ncbi:hypothetical protein L7F22_062780 [Adiantum nelumboides]|nr:hypothetical protein [Adiantum nelumboides]
MFTQGLPVDLNNAWMDEDSLVPSSLRKFDSQIDDNYVGGFDAAYGTTAPSSTTPLCNNVADNMPNAVLRSPITSTVGPMMSLLLHGNATPSPPRMPLTPPICTARPSPLTPTTTTRHMEQAPPVCLPTTSQPSRRVPIPRPRQDNLSLTHNQDSNDATPAGARSRWPLLEVFFCVRQGKQLIYVKKTVAFQYESANVGYG